MKVPRGSKLGLYRLPDVTLADVVKKVSGEKVTGYVRFTAEKKTLMDFYLFLIKGEVVGAYAETLESQSFGDAAKDAAFFPCERGLIDVRGLEETVISLLIENYPEARVSTFTIPEMPVKKEMPADTKFLHIANLKIPHGRLLEFHLSVGVTGFWELLEDLEGRRFSGYFRVFAEEDEAPRDGCIILSEGKAKGALYESGNEVKYGDEALFRVLFTFALKSGVIDFHALEPLYLKSVLENPALALSGTPQEVFHRIEEEEVETVKRARAYFSIPEGEQVVASQVRELAAFEILLRTLQERNLDGYVVLSFHTGAGILIVEGGRPRAAFYQSGRTVLTAGQALEAFLDQIQEETSVKIFALQHEEVQKALGRQEASIKASDSVSEAIMRELGEDFFVEIRQAHLFKEEFEKKKKSVR